ncbi:hypothetical protein B0H14DRAFT_3521760 [Mycena olivaceomarginata]|nr:hypothetical protein B0H14DRAFT_3521760 [Mycena olivaceomarginata]
MTVRSSALLHEGVGSIQFTACPGVSPIPLVYIPTLTTSRDEKGPDTIGADSDSSEDEPSDAESPHTSPISAPTELRNIDPDEDIDIPANLLPITEEIDPQEMLGGPQREDNAEQVESSSEHPEHTATTLTDAANSISAPTIATATPALPLTDTSRAGRKRFLRPTRDDLCLCDNSAIPTNPASITGLAHCKNDGCETKWYHLECLNKDRAYLRPPVPALTSSSTIFITVFPLQNLLQIQTDSLYQRTLFLDCGLATTKRERHGLDFERIGRV